MTVLEAYTKVQSQGKKVANPTTRQFPLAASPGDYARQGDLNIIYLETEGSLEGFVTPGELSQKTRLATENSLQLVEGSSTGSNHVMTGDFLVKERSESELIGPMIFVKSGGEITHPTHGNVKLNDNCFYGIEYQRSHAEELRRVRD